MWESIFNELSRYDSYEWIILFSGLCYAALSMLNKPSCWVFGIISCGLLAFKDFTAYNLLFDGVLQIFYVILGIFGLYKWKYSTVKEGVPIVFSLPFISHLNAWLLALLSSFILVFLINFFLNPAFALLDSLTTVFSIWATWLLINRVYENWIYWIIINIIYIGLYYSQGGVLVSVLYAFYLLAAIGGLYTWNKPRKEANSLFRLGLNKNP